MMAVKASSIDSIRPPEQIYDQEATKLQDSGISIIQRIPLEPFDKAHQMILGKWIG